MTPDSDETTRTLSTIKTVDFMGLPLADITVDAFSQWMIERARARRNNSAQHKPAFVTYLNAWCTIVAERDEEYRSLIKNCDCLYADGMAVVWAAKLLRTPIPERVNAGDFIANFLRECANAKLRIHLIGGKKGVAEKTARCWTAMIPNLVITGYEPGYFDSPEHEARIVQNIKRVAPDILLVGMGVPHQEKWTARHIDEINCAISWNVGALFEYFGNKRPRAPIWMRNIGMEWAFRLVLEPKRLCGRYTLGNIRFIANVIRERMRKSMTAKQN